MRGSVIYGCIVVEGAEILHDVHLAAGGPGDRPDVLAQHPEGGPDTFAERKLDSGLNPAVLPTQISRVRGSARTAGLKTGRRVSPGGVPDGPDHKIAMAILKDIVRGVGVDFGLAVAPAPASEIEVPLGRVGRGASRVVELLAPDELPVGRLSRHHEGGER